MSKVKFTVSRKEPAGDQQRDVTYEVDLVEGMTVLDGLTQIKDWQDNTLSYRSSCRSAICGSCAVQINGHSKLACKTQVSKELEKCDEIRVAPLGNFPVLKDLVADLEPFWKQVKSVTPWLVEKDEDDAAPLTEKQMERFKGVEDCILCGACYGQCTSYSVEKNFIGPAALAKGYRFTVDPKDAIGHERLDKGLQADKGIWSCARCYFCSEVCPKDVQPARAIGRLQQLAVDEGRGDSEGTRYARALKHDIASIGRINEATLPLRVSNFNPLKIKEMIPLGISLLLKGKMPSPLPRRIKGIHDIRNIFKRLRDSRGEK